MSANDYRISAEKLQQIRSLMDAIKRMNAGKKPTAEQLRLLRRLDEDRRPRSDRWTVTEAANHLIVDVKTVSKGLRDLGFEIGREETYAVKDVIRAVYGDEQAEKVRAMKLDNEERERKARKSVGDLIDRDQAEKQIAEYFTLPIKQALDSLPAALCTLCNPSDPDLARDALERWKEETKRQLREKLT